MNRLYLAKKLVKLAKELVAIPTATFDEYDKFDKEYQKQLGKQSDSTIWDLFKTKKEKEDFLKAKSIAHPNLSEIISTETLGKILSKGYFVICSAGLNDVEAQDLKDKIIAEYGKMDNNKFNEMKKKIVKPRYEELRGFLDHLNCPYYEVIGQFYNDILKTEIGELSYIVDLTNVGKNDDAKAKSLMIKITKFCGNNMEQCSTIEGINSVNALVNCGDRSYRKSRGKSTDFGYGRSTVRTNQTDGMHTWVDDYGFGDTNSPDATKGDWLK